MTTDFYLSGSEEELKGAISLLIAINKMLDDRDIGQFVGEPIEEHTRALPHSVRLRVIYYSVKVPPWKGENGKKLVQATYNIPDVARAKADWTIIKTAMGGANGYDWGRFRATANLDNGRQMQVYGSTKQNAEERLKALAELSTAKILTLTIAEEEKVGVRATDKWLYKADTRMYPAFFVLVNSKKIIKESNKQLISDNAVSTKKRSRLEAQYEEYGTRRIPLWTDTEPSYAKPTIQKALSVSADDD